MKTKQLIAVVILSVFIFGANALTKNKSTLQDKETETVNAVFDGYDADNGYAFLIVGEEYDEEIVYFNAITEEALKSVNLKSDDFIGKRFEITYDITEYEEEDENGYIEVFEHYTITKVKAL